VKLEIAERINLLNILPVEGNIVTLRVVNELRLDLGFSETELAEAKIMQTEDGRITWDASAVLVKDVKIGDTAREIITEALKKLDGEKKLTPQLVPIWDKFMVPTA